MKCTCHEKSDLFCGHDSHALGCPCHPRNVRASDVLANANVNEMAAELTNWFGFEKNGPNFIKIRAMLRRAYEAGEKANGEKAK